MRKSKKEGKANPLLFLMARKEMQLSLTKKQGTWDIARVRNCFTSL